MEYTVAKSIVMIGLMGAGKTAVGNLVAQKLGIPFRDSDHEIEKAANLTIPEIFDKFGEDFFREKETQVLSRLLDEAPCVLSTGGGAFMNEYNRQNIANNAISVWLRAELSVLWERVKHRNTRPLLQVSDPYEVLKTLHEKRSPIYELASIAVDSEKGISLQDMADKVVSSLLKDKTSGVEQVSDE